MNDLSTTHAVAAGAALILAVVAWLGDLRRMRRSNPDDVGFMPWTPVFFLALLAACVLLGLVAREWLGG